LKEYNEVKAELRAQYVAKLENHANDQADLGEVYANEGRVFNFNVDFKSLTKQSDLESLYNVQDDKVI